MGKEDRSGDIQTNQDFGSKQDQKIKLCTQMLPQLNEYRDEKARGMASVGGPERSQGSNQRSRGIYSIDYQGDENKGLDQITRGEGQLKDGQIHQHQEDKLIEIQKQSEPSLATYIQNERQQNIENQQIDEKSGVVGTNKSQVLINSGSVTHQHQGGLVATIDQARYSQKDSQQFVEFTEIYGDVENCDLCGEVFERHHRDYNLETNLRIEHMRFILNQTQKDQTLGQSLLHSRTGSVVRKLDYIQNKNLHASGGKEILLFKHVTTLNSPQVAHNQNQSMFFPQAKENSLTPINKNNFSSHLEQQQYLLLQNNAKNFLTRVNEEEKEAVNQNIENSNEKSNEITGQNQALLKSNLNPKGQELTESLNQNGSPSLSIKASSLQRKKKLDAATIQSLEKDLRVLNGNTDGIQDQTPRGELDTKNLNKEVTEFNPDGGLASDELQHGENIHKVNLSKRLQAFNRSKSTQLTIELFRNNLRGFEGRQTIQIDQEALTSLKNQSKEFQVQFAEKKQKNLNLRHQNTTLQHQSSPLDRIISDGMALRLKWREKLRKLEPYFENKLLCQLCFNNEVQNPHPSNNLCDQCSERLEKIHSAEDLGCDDYEGIGAHDGVYQDMKNKSSNCRVCGLQEHHKIREDDTNIVSKGFAIDNMQCVKEEPFQNYRTDNIEYGNDGHLGYPSQIQIQSCGNYIRSLYTRLKLKQFRHLYEFCQSASEQQDILQQAQQFQFCLQCDRVIRKYGALRCQHLTCHHCNITFCMYCREIIFYQKWSRKKDKRITQHGLQLLKDHFNPFSLNSCKMMSGTKNYQSYKEQIRIRENIQNSLNYSQISFDRHAMDQESSSKLTGGLPDKQRYLKHKKHQSPRQQVPILHYLNEQARKIAIEGDPEYIHSSLLNIQLFSTLPTCLIKLIMGLMIILWMIVGLPMALLMYLTVSAKSAYNYSVYRENECHYLYKRPTKCQKCQSMVSQILKYILILPLLVPVVFTSVIVGFHGLVTKLMRRSLVE